MIGRSSRPRRKLSVAGRKRIAEAQRARWAKVREEKGTKVEGTIVTKAEKRVLETEPARVEAGKKSAALSSHRALFYHDVPPELYRRVAKRHTGGHLKYIPEITQNLNWREGLEDPHYIMDRLNHMFEHMIEFLENGNEADDNLGAIAWCAGFLMEAERVSPELLKACLMQARYHGKSATEQKEKLLKEQV